MADAVRFSRDQSDMPGREVPDASLRPADDRPDSFLKILGSEWHAPHGPSGPRARSPFGSRLPVSSVGLRNSQLGGNAMDAMTMPRPGVGRQALTFGRHFLEMCIPMCLVGVPLTLFVLGAISSVAGAELREQYPGVALLVAALTLTAPMAAWMLFRGMPVRPTLEMSAAAFAVAIALIGASAIGLVGQGAIQLTVGEFCGMVCIAMVVVMLFRLDLYTGRAGHHMGQATPGI
jgi:hypothetical protein